MAIKTKNGFEAQKLYVEQQNQARGFQVWPDDGRGVHSRHPRYWL